MRSGSRYEKLGGAIAGATAICSVLVAAAAAYGTGYPTHLPKRVEITEVFVRLPGAPRSRVGILAKTNSRGQIVTVISGQISGVSLSCSQGAAELSTQSEASVENEYHVSAGGAFSYTEEIPYSTYTLAVAGRFSDHGTRLAGTAALTSSATPGSFAIDTGCASTLSGALGWSAKPHWVKFGL